MSLAWTPKLRLSILERDNHTCQKCGAKNHPLHMHHIDGNMTNNDPSNLTTLCKECHIHLPRKPYRISNVGPFGGIRSSTLEGHRKYSRLYRMFFTRRRESQKVSSMYGDVSKTLLECYRLAFSVTIEDVEKWFFHHGFIIGERMV